MKITRERMRLWLAIAGSIFVHLLVAFSLAAFGRPSAPLLNPDDAPPELTMIDLSATPPPTVAAKPAYMETDPTKESQEAPKEKTFESNANSIAKSDSPATGDAPLPSQEGKDRPFLEVQTQDSSLPAEGKTARPELQPTPPPQPTATPAPVQTPKPKPSQPPQPTPLPEPLATPEPDRLAMLTGTPPLALRDAEDAENADATPPPQVGPTDPPVVSRPRPERPASSYQAEKQETRVTGRLTDRGPSAVNAVATPLGRYQKSVSDAIGVLWYRYTKERMDLISIGTAHIEGEVDASGKVRNLRVVSNDANEAFANICLQSFQEAQIPPIPPDLIATLPNGKLQLDFHFTTYANR